jgi:ubiquinone/menaquinone biosynthesis C-methylase UbiE
MYESPAPRGRAFIFRNGAELARRACLSRASPGQVWLDVGCGSGHLAAALQRAGLQVIGVDADARMVDAARARFADEDASSPVRFEVAEAERLPFDDATLDGVVSTSLVGCLKRPEPFLRELDRVLRPGGTAVITFTNGMSLRYALPRMRGLDHTRRFRPYTRTQVNRMLPAAGLSIEELRYYNCFVPTATQPLPPPRIAKRLERIANLSIAVGDLIARNLLVIASKC